MSWRSGPILVRSSSPYRLSYSWSHTRATLPSAQLSSSVGICLQVRSDRDPCGSIPVPEVYICTSAKNRRSVVSLSSTGSPPKNTPASWSINSVSMPISCHQSRISDCVACRTGFVEVWYVIRKGVPLYSRTPSPSVSSTPFSSNSRFAPSMSCVRHPSFSLET